jgi:hypothetical protein
MDGGSAGLIARTRRELRAQGRELTLSHPQRQVRRVIELCAALAGPREDLDRNPISVPRLPRAEALAVGP